MMWSKLFFMFYFITLKIIRSEEVGDECEPNNDVADGVCTLITECDAALRAIRQNNHHTFKRCGFEDIYEIVCCPKTTTTSTTTTKFGPPDRSNTERISERECKKIMQTSTPPLDLHIIGGEAASLGEFPHMVAIGYDRGNGYQFDCGGALVSTSYVLTAAHCVTNLERIEPTMIRAGVLDLGGNTWNEETDYRVAESIPHPSYAHSAKYHDIALLRLEKPVEVSSNLNAACLYTGSSDPLGPLTITGWGRISTTQNLKSNMLLKTNVTAVPRRDCDPHYSNWRKLPRGIGAGQLCAGDPRGGHDACQGDSGGPLQTIVGSEQVNRVVGVTSFGKGCGSTLPGVYTRVSHYLDWVEPIVWSD